MPDQRLNDIKEWFIAQYVAGVGLSGAEGGTTFKQFVGTLPVAVNETDNNVDAILPIAGRIQRSFLELKLRYPIGSGGYSCLAMVANLDGVSTHFGYAYWRRGWESEGPEYICVSPTFESRDGEYRCRFIRGSVFLKKCEEFASELAPYEEAILAMVAGPLELMAIAYPKSNSSIVEDLVTQADDLRLPILAFAVALALDVWDIRRGIVLTAHTNTNYIKLLGAIPITHPISVLTRWAEYSFTRGCPNRHSVKCGQKIVPMFTRETMQPSDYNLATWRELAITRLASDLVLNFVSPSFALYNQWTYIEGVDETLFENAAMASRYARSRAVEATTRSLREARRGLGLAEQNYYTEELNAHVYESLMYAQSHLVMSPIAIAHTMEDVGWTMESLPRYVRYAGAQWPAAIDAFASADTAARHLFELAYAAHCLHAKAGVAHTDLHVNNMTLYIWGDSVSSPMLNNSTVPPPYYDDPVVAYAAGPRGEADTFVFPAAGDSACIIDYSRCILGPAFRPRLEEGRSPQYATNFYRDQVNRVMRALHRYAPEYIATHQNAIKAATLANFEAVFPVLCAIDFIAIGANMAALLEVASTPCADEVRPFVVAPGAVALALRLEEVGRELLITGLLDLVENASAKRTPAAFPGAAVLPRVFGEWLFPRWAAREPRRARSAQLVDAYNFANELGRHSGNDYAKFPPWARLDEIERHLGEVRMTDLFERGVEPFLEALRPGTRVEVIAEQTRAQQEKLNGAGASAASSWIDE